MYIFISDSKKGAQKDPLIDTKQQKTIRAASEKSRLLHHFAYLFVLIMQVKAIPYFGLLEPSPAPPPSICFTHHPLQQCS